MATGTTSFGSTTSSSDRASCPILGSATGCSRGLRRLNADRCGELVPVYVLDVECAARGFDGEGEVLPLERGLKGVQDRRLRAGAVLRDQEDSVCALRTGGADEYE